MFLRPARSAVWLRTGPLLYFDFPTQTYRPFLLSAQLGVGRLATLISTPDALYMADMASAGAIRRGLPPSGVI